MWLKRINKILHDKNDYHLDPSLKRHVEISDDLLQATIRYQKYLIPRKVRYFFKYDKLFFLRLFSKYLLWFFISLIGLGLFSIAIILLFGIDIDFKKVPKKDFKNIPVYVPSTGDATKDSLNIMFYKRNLNKDAYYIIFYLKDPSKDYKKWKAGLYGLESGNETNPYEARSDNGTGIYWGKYQMGPEARNAIGLGNITWEQWKNNPELQEAAVPMWIDRLYDALDPYIKKYDGKFLNGWSITESGIIAMAHNVGPAPVITWLNSKCTGPVPKDGSHRDATRYLILGNYDLRIRK